MKQGFRKALVIGWTAMCSGALLYVYLQSREYLASADTGQRAQANLVMSIIFLVVWQTPFILAWAYRRIGEWLETQD
jgi:hypothetical protein